MTLPFIIASLMFFAGQAGKSGIPMEKILGTWHGTSICVDKNTDTACRDEVVVYEIDTAKVSGGHVMLHGYKIVNKEKDWMGDLEFAYEAKTGTWWSDFAPPRGGKIEFRFLVSDSTMSGTLVELPAKRLIRKIEVKR